MGIVGLLQFLKPVLTQIHISSLAGKIVAVDALVWLHKGVYTCGTDVALGKPPNSRTPNGQREYGYVAYCRARIAQLRAAGLFPVLVFDGASLQAKELTEARRAEYVLA